MSHCGPSEPRRRAPDSSAGGGLADAREADALDDAELARLCAASDERAWEILVRRYRRLVYAIPSRAGLPTEQIEEVFHETFAKLAERMEMGGAPGICAHGATPAPIGPHCASGFGSTPHRSPHLRA